MEPVIKSNTFTEEGRIMQVEYAIKNVSKAPSMIGLVCTNGLILLGFKTKPTLQREKIFKINANIYVGVAGMFSDGIQLITLARMESENYRESFEQEMCVKSLANVVGENKQDFTLGAGLRPFGVSIMYAGKEEEEGNFCLYSTDPSGSVNRWKKLCVGDSNEQINSKLKEVGDVSIEQGMGELFKILKVCKDCGRKDIDKLEVMHMYGDKRVFLTAEQIGEYIKE